VTLCVSWSLVSFYRTQTQLEHSTVSDKKPTDLTTSAAVIQALGDQPGTSSVYSRPLVEGRHRVQENGNLETLHHHVPPSFDSEAHEPWYAKRADEICFVL